MKISKREKVMLLILGILGIGILYYQFGYTALVKSVEEKTKVKNEIEQKYNTARNTIDSMESQESKVKTLKAKITDQAGSFYPTISQEHIILELDKLIKESGLEGGMKFEATEVKGIESIKKSEKDKELPESSLQADADEYNYKYGESKGEKNATAENTDSKTNNSSEQNSANASNASSKKSTKDSNSNKENTVTQLKVNIDFNGSYENVVKFLKSLGDYERKIPVYTIDMTQKNLEEVAGAVNIIIYSIPKIDDETNRYLKWDLNNMYGKAQPFNVGSAAGTGIKSGIDVSDFMVGVKSSTSELPTLMIGKANDDLRTTYAYGDGNNEQNAEIVLTKRDDKYYYKYKTNIDKIPVSYSDLGNEFVPNSDNIVVNISSESRVSDDDKSGVKLKITNNTDKLVKVNVTGDDIRDPRVSIDGDSKNVSVN
ncbi:pilus assembly protein PilO [Clostridium sp. MF28]|uniref:pilus assembly protein PilO n=1 Tax=Clostridium TaxID=1485 RepID=UPI000CFA6C55|nr:MULTISPECIES: pilus assembly protein PilO [Clostridium]AVK48215.1 pilus assembly protein PilO [Clostridium sp. MF28]PSM58408.1 pilus assembly protein PilO [Clostridium diolis]